MVAHGDPEGAEGGPARLVPLTRARGLRALQTTLSRIPGDVAAFRGLVSGRDLLLFFLFPAIITLVELLCTLSPPLRDALQLHYTGFHWWQFITCAFVHSGSGHYLNNVTSYLLLGAVALVLAAGLRNTRLFFVPFGIMAVAIPLLDAAFKVFLFPSIAPAFFARLGTASGSSGIIAGLLGLLPLLWLLALSRLGGRDLLDSWSVYLVLSYAPFALVMAYQPGLNLPTVTVAAVMAGLAAVSWWKARYILLGMGRAAAGNIVCWMAIALAPVLYLVLPFVLFPRDLVSGNTLVDFAGHYLGLVAGIVIGGIAIQVLRGDGEEGG
jgi:hypothetical protein